MKNAKLDFGTTIVLECVNILTLELVAYKRVNVMSVFVIKSKAVLTIVSFLNYRTLLNSSDKYIVNDTMFFSFLVTSNYPYNRTNTSVVSGQMTGKSINQ